jgi:hypothetical protein
MEPSLVNIAETGGKRRNAENLPRGYRYAININNFLKGDENEEGKNKCIFSGGGCFDSVWVGMERRE